MDKNTIINNTGPEPGDLKHQLNKSFAVDLAALRPEPGETMNCSCFRCNNLLAKRPKSIIVEPSEPLIPPPLVHGKHQQYVRGETKPMLTMTQYCLDVKLSHARRFGYVTGVILGLCMSLVIGVFVWWGIS